MTSRGLGQLRSLLADEIADLPDEDLEDALGAEVAYQLEDLAGIARTVGKHVKKAGPGALQGAVTGFLTGGPMGAALGAAAGAAQPYLGKAGSTAQPSPVAAPQSPPVGAAPQASGAGNTAVANPAALQLLLTMLRPEVTDALLAMALGRRGAQTVPVGERDVPVAAFSNLIQSLAERASVDHHTSRRAGPYVPGHKTAIPRYLAGHVTRAELASPEGRADALLRLLADAGDDAEGALAEGDIEEDDERWLDEEAEALDLAEIDRLGGID